MVDNLLMSPKERRRLTIMSQVVANKITLKKAALLMNVSYRQAKRIKHNYIKSGDAGLIHASRGRRSNNRKSDALRSEIIQQYKDHYPDFGPTLAVEKIQESGYCIDHETLRRWLIEEGLWTRKRKRSQFRQRRERKHHFGEMIQIDGSPHDWFEGRREKCCLMNMVDDATGRSFSEEETKEAAMRLLWGWIDKYGIPESIYCDRKNIYVTEREPSIKEQLAGLMPKTDFEKACESLGIQVIRAYSPQAKGRVERKHGVYQDRLVKELRLASISTIEDANTFLENGYLEKLNKKFYKPPLSTLDKHAVVFKKTELQKIFVFEEERAVSNDWIVQYKNRLFQILKKNKYRPQPGDKVIVHQWLDGTLHFLFQGKELLINEFGVECKKEETASSKVG